MVKVTFSTVFSTQWGQSVRLCGSSPELGAWDWNKALFLNFSHPDLWQVTVDIADVSKEITYKFAVSYEHGGIQFEWGHDRVLSLTKSYENAYLRDYWRPSNDIDNVLFSSVFTEALFKPLAKRDAFKTVEKPSGVVLRFQLPVPRINNTDKVVLVGDIPELGNWDVKKGLVLANPQHPLWQGEVQLKKIPAGINYKFAIVNSTTNEVTEWEAGTNRYFHVLDFVAVPKPEIKPVSKPASKADSKTEAKAVAKTEAQAPQLISLTEQKFRFSSPWRGAGVALPVFSLRTQESFGCGEFADIKALVDWAKKVGLKVVQILPINDTVATHRWKDSYPYAGITVYGLHPIYMNLKKLGKLASPTTQAIIDECGKKLNAHPEVDYEGVHKLKSRFFKLIFDENMDKFLADPEFHTFFKQNKEWLLPYAAFSYLRDLYQTPNFHQWGKFASVTMEDLEDLADPKAKQFPDIAVHYFIQFYLHKQLLEASQYAKDNGIVLKGDIPIGIYRHSVDAWMYPSLFHMDMQAGAPPDAFAEGGQNWGFPTYNWEEMAKDNFKWWTSRLQKMSEYFSAFRIDHVLGFFRIWQIPTSQVQGIMGFFNPAIPIHVNEFGERGIWFNKDRYCKPFIRDYTLNARLGELADYAKKNFLVETSSGEYALRPHVDTQAKVRDFLQISEEMSIDERTLNERLRAGLYALINDVIFFEVEGSNGHEFHPRHSMEKTFSYQALDDGTKQKLRELYVDYFYKRQEGFWRHKAMIKLPVIKAATEMLICAEDLGMVPDCVSGVLDELNMLRLAIQRMPADPKVEFWHPADTPYLCVASPSCHDMSTIRGWWEEDRARSERFYKQILGHHDKAAPYFCEPSLVKEVVVQHLYAPCMLSVFPIQDLVGMDDQLRRKNPQSEQINNPANPEHYWRYRFHMNLEDLIKADGFNGMLKGLIGNSGRL